MRRSAPALTAGQDIGICKVAHSGLPVLLIHRRHATTATGLSESYHYVDI
jgi:hypothetical protein